MENKFEVKKVVSLDKETVKDILTTAVEGGINYWAILDNTTPQYIEARTLAREELGDVPCYCDILYKCFELGYEVRFEDAEGDDTWNLTHGMFLLGCQKYEEEGHDIQKEMEDGVFDAISADTIMQYALFGEIVFE